MTSIDMTEIDVKIIGEMISMMMTKEMTTIRIITTEIIQQGMTGGHTRVIDITMIVGRTIEDLKDLDSFNIIRRVEIILNPKMFDNHNMKREKRMNQRCRTAIRVGKMITMQINVHQNKKEKHRR